MVKINFKKILVRISEKSIKILINSNWYLTDTCICIYLIIISLYSLIISNYWLKLSKCFHMSYLLNIGYRLVKYWFRVLIKHQLASVCFYMRAVSYHVLAIIMNEVLTKINRVWPRFEKQDIQKVKLEMKWKDLVCPRRKLNWKKCQKIAENFHC